MTNTRRNCRMAQQFRYASSRHATGEAVDSGRAFVHASGIRSQIVLASNTPVDHAMRRISMPFGDAPQDPGGIYAATVHSPVRRYGWSALLDSGVRAFFTHKR